MKKLGSVVLVGATILIGCQTQPPAQQIGTVIRQDQIMAIQNLFQQANIKGTITIFDGQTYASYGTELNRASTAYIPASTFKMLNALIALQYGKTTTTEVFKWDGQKRSFPAWEKDMTLAEAMQASAVPVYQEVARRIGLDLMQREVKRVGFGSQNIGTQVDRFWLVGPLTITPEQEAKFAYELATGQLAFSETVQQQVKQMLLIEQKDDYRLYAKSGWGMDVEPMVGWYTGWVKQPDGQITAFALNMAMPEATDPAIRKTLVLKSLDILHLYPS